MHDKRFPKWRSWVAAALLLLVATIIFFEWRGSGEEKPAKVAVTPELPKIIPPKPLQILDRAALIEAAAKAASAHAAGTSIDQALAELAGRRFELALPLGCGGPLPNDTQVENGWQYDAESGNLQVAFPSNILDEPANSDENTDSTNVDAQVRLGKSFWIDREWLREAVCPVDGEPLAAPTPPDSPSVAIAELGVAEAPRANDRDGADYRVSKRVALDEAPNNQGLRIIISGKLASGGPAPVQCRSVSKNKRPICIILARFDRIAVTNDTRSETYGEWQN